MVADLSTIDLKVAPAIALPFTGAFIGSQLVPETFDSEWFENLEKPSFQPPNFVFPIAWTFLYATMGYASYLVYEDNNQDVFDSYPLVLYGIQLILNWAWTPILFGTRNLRLVCITIYKKYLPILYSIYRYFLKPFCYGYQLLRPQAHSTK